MYIIKSDENQEAIKCRLTVDSSFKRFGLSRSCVGRKKNDDREGIERAKRVNWRLFQTFVLYPFIEKKKQSFWEIEMEIRFVEENETKKECDEQTIKISFSKNKNKKKGSFLYTPNSRGCTRPNKNQLFYSTLFWKKRYEKQIAKVWFKSDRKKTENQHFSHIFCFFFFPNRQKGRAWMLYHFPYRILEICMVQKIQQADNVKREKKVNTACETYARSMNRE